MSRDKFGEDPPENQLNIGNLNKTFGISSNPDTMETQVKDMKDTLEETSKELEKAEQSENKPDPDSVLYQNIDRANRLLDKLENQMDTGQTEARVFEVASQLINAITTASSSIVGVNEHSEELEYKYKWLEHKEKELQVKQALKDGKSDEEGQQVTNNNLIVTSREDLMNLIESQRQEGGDTQKDPQETSE